MRLSLRLKLTLWVLAIFAVIQWTVSIVVLLYQRKAARTMLDTHLELRLDTIRQSLVRNQDEWTTESLRTLARHESTYLYIADLQIVIFDEDAARVAGSADEFDEMLLGQLGLLAQSAAETLSLGSASIASANGAGDDRLRLACKTFTTPDDRHYALCIVASDRPVGAFIRTASTVLLIVAPISLLAVGACAWYVAGVAVAPLQDLRRVARAIKPGDLSRPIDLTASSAEVSRLREELDGAMKRLNEGYSSQARFLANVSHELKTPIGVILAESQTLQSKEELPEDVREFVDSVGEEMHRLGRLIESFLLLTRVQEGKVKTADRQCSVNDLMVSSLENTGPMAKSYGVRLRPHLLEAEQLETSVIGDPELLSTAIDNLIRNAIRFSPEGKAIDITASLKANRAVIAVRDRGAGIPEDLVDTIFDRFAQANSEVRRGRGTGLGLEIAKSIAELHDGDLRVRNLNIGCVFELSLPVMSASEADHDQE